MRVVNRIGCGREHQAHAAPVPSTVNRAVALGPGNTNSTSEIAVSSIGTAVLHFNSRACRSEHRNSPELWLLAARVCAAQLLQFRLSAAWPIRLRMQNRKDKSPAKAKPRSNMLARHNGSSRPSRHLLDSDLVYVSVMACAASGHLLRRHHAALKRLTSDVLKLNRRVG